MAKIIRNLLIGAAATSLTACAHHAAMPGCEPTPPAAAGAQDQQWLEHEKQFGGDHEVQDVLNRYRGLILPRDIAYDAPGVVALQRGTDRALCQTNTGAVTCKDLARQRNGAANFPGTIGPARAAPRAAETQDTIYLFKVVSIRYGVPQCVQLGHSNNAEACAALLQQAKKTCIRTNNINPAAAVQRGQIYICRQDATREIH